MTLLVKLLFGIIGLVLAVQLYYRWLSIVITKKYINWKEVIFFSS